MENKKKILHVIQSLGNGGWENALLRLLPLLTDKFEHHVIALRELGELAPRFAEKGIPVTTVHWSGFFDIPGYRRLLSETRQFAPNAIITYLFHADMIGRLFLQKKISVSIIPFLGTTYNHPRYWSARVLERLTKKFVRHYLANSPAVKDFYVNKLNIPEEKITIIPTGIDVNYFNATTPDPKLKASLGIKPQDFVIICVANLHINKGHRYLLRAIDVIYQKHPDIHLLIVGDGAERENLKNQIKEYASRNNVSFLGRRTDVPQLLKISDCFVLPTLFEGMSNAIMEAMASSLPVITTDIPENRALVENGKTGILVPAKDASRIAASIHLLTSDPEKRRFLGGTAKNFIQEKYSLQLSVEKLSHFLHLL